ncbi:MAG: hypothetical protein AB7N76_27965 [Planctomycetota bacterium]
MRVEFCASCGAPLEARWSEIVIVCRYCGSQNAPGGVGDPVPSSHPDDGRPRFSIGGRTYLIEGRLGSGDSCEVYRGRWVARLGELVVIKVLRALDDVDLRRREWDLLGKLHRSEAQGALHFVTRLPQPIALGPLRAFHPDREDGDGGPERLVSVFGWHPGFLHTLEEVHAVHPQGVPSRVVVWLFKRLLELLGFLHRAGVVHGAVIPPHVLVHPRDHGALLVGFGCATSWAPTSRAPGRQEPLPAISRAWRDLYPAPVLAERWVSPRTDIAMAARCALLAAGAESFQDDGCLTGGLGALVLAAAHLAHDDAWALRDELDRASAQVHGPPSYNPLAMPGW